jgi:hypothetical protein
MATATAVRWASSSSCPTAPGGRVGQRLGGDQEAGQALGDGVLGDGVAHQRHGPVVHARHPVAGVGGGEGRLRVGPALVAERPGELVDGQAGGAFAGGPLQDVCDERTAAPRVVEPHARQHGPGQRVGLGQPHVGQVEQPPRVLAQDGRRLRPVHASGGTGQLHRQVGPEQQAGDLVGGRRGGEGRDQPVGAGGRDGGQRAQPGDGHVVRGGDRGLRQGGGQRAAQARPEPGLGKGLEVRHLRH